MVWDRDSNRTVRAQHLRLAAPDVVYAALRDYGDFLTEGNLAYADQELERLLLDRKSPLIDLALAQHGYDNTILLKLYQQACAGTVDPAHDKAIRLAVLGNRTVWRTSFTPFELELKRLAREGDDNEMRALLGNRYAAKIVCDVLKRREAFEGLNDERMLHLVGYASPNTSYSTDDGDECYALQQALWNLLRTAPLTSGWLRVLYQTLLEVYPPLAARPQSGDEVREVLTRWQSVKVEDSSGTPYEGYCTKLPMQQEFRCWIAALYGGVLAGMPEARLGLAESDDVAMRCVYYGKGLMRPEAMRAAQQNDEDAYPLAAVLNESNYFDRDARGELEDLLTRKLTWVYEARCKRMAKRYRGFAVGPISTELAEERRRVPPVAPATPADMKALSEQLVQLKERVEFAARCANWAFAGLIGLAILIWVRT